MKQENKLERKLRIKLASRKDAFGCHVTQKVLECLVVMDTSNGRFWNRTVETLELG